MRLKLKLKPSPAISLWGSRELFERMYSIPALVLPIMEELHPLYRDIEYSVMLRFVIRLFDNLRA